MTTIYYDGKDLYADHRVATASSPTVFRDNGVKIHTSKNNQFAYGLGGTLPDEDKRAEFEEGIREIFAEMHMHTRIPVQHVGKFSEKLGELFEGQSVVAMTCDRGFVINGDKFCPLYGEVGAIGSGGTFMIGLNHYEKDIAKCFDLLSPALDAMSSKTFSKIAGSSLQSFVVG